MDAARRTTFSGGELPSIIRALPIAFFSTFSMCTGGGWVTEQPEKEIRTGNTTEPQDALEVFIGSLNDINTGVMNGLIFGAGVYCRTRASTSV